MCLDKGNTIQRNDALHMCDFAVWMWIFEMNPSLPSSNPSAFEINLQPNPSFIHLTWNDDAFKLLKQNQVILSPDAHGQLHPKRVKCGTADVLHVWGARKSQTRPAF